MRTTCATSQMADTLGGTTTLTTGTASPRITFGQNRVAKGEISPEARSARPVLWFIGGKQDAVTQAVYTGPATSTAITMDISVKEAVTDFENLYDAMQHCANGGRWKASVIKYLQNGLVNTDQLRRDLLNGTYKIGKQVKFKVYEPKERTVVAMRFRDRQVQRSLLNNYLANELSLGFIYDMDDFIIITNGRGMASSYRLAIEQELDKIQLQLNSKKCRVTPARKGFKWLGFRIRIKPSGKILVTLNKDKIYHERRKLKRMVRLVKVGRLPRETADASLQCWAAHAKRGNNHMVINKMYTYYRNLWRDTNV